MRVAGFSAVAAALAALTGRAAQGATAAPGNEIVGTWEVQTPDPIGFALQTFTFDGGYISTTGGHLTHTPDHGAWVRSGEGRFFVETISYGFAGGAPVSRRATQLDITLAPDGNSYTENVTYEEFDLAGNSLGATLVTGTATRIIPHLPS